jgi:serine/threonine-protein kinase ULK/ATG1
MVQESAEHMYLVMEFCDGGDLAKYIAKNKPLDEALVRKFAQQIGMGVCKCS